MYRDDDKLGTEVALLVPFTIVDGDKEGTLLFDGDNVKFICCVGESEGMKVVFSSFDGTIEESDDGESVPFDGANVKFFSVGDKEGAEVSLFSIDGAIVVFDNGESEGKNVLFGCIGENEGTKVVFAPFDKNDGEEEGAKVPFTFDGPNVKLFCNVGDGEGKEVPFLSLDGKIVEEIDDGDNEGIKVRSKVSFDGDDVDDDVDDDVGDVGGNEVACCGTLVG